MIQLIKTHLSFLIFIVLIITADNTNSQTRIGDYSAFVTQSIPTNMNTGEPYKVILTFRNNGTTVWTSSSSANISDYKLALVDYYDRYPGVSWGVSESPVTKSIEPGETVTFELNIVAPSTPGTYNFEWSMQHNGSYFGEHSTPVTVNVGTYISSLTNSAAFVEQRLPEVMTAGHTYDVKITMTNSGKSTWLSGLYKLVYLDPRMNPGVNNIWGISAVPLTENIGPGSTYDFNFKVTAPVERGFYTFQWGMMSGDGQVFGDASRYISVNVTPSPVLKKDNDNDAYQKKIKKEKKQGEDEKEKARDGDDK